MTILYIVCITAIIISLGSLLSMYVIITKLCNTLLQVTLMQKTDKINEAREISETDLPWLVKEKKIEKKEMKKERRRKTVVEKIEEEKLEREAKEWETV